MIGIDDIRAAAMSRRSPLYRWMSKHHDEFASILAEAGRPNWTAIAAAFARDGLTDSDGTPPTAEVARKTWWKVRKAKEAAQRTTSRTANAQPRVSPARTRRPARSDDDDNDVY